MEVEKAYQKQVKHRKTSLEEYCEMYPDALECLIYDI
ncbi:MAG: CP12 domain-containing protein [Dolichospermum sp.]